jgi:endonuclease/exonuclease/phosphatase (EEP) superfamily protein YafD
MNTLTRVKITKPGVTPIFTWIVSLCFICIGLVDAEPSAPEAKLRVLTYNVFVGFKDDVQRHAQAVEWIAAQHPDVVALQELNGYTEEKLSEDARAWGHPHAKLCITKSGYHLGITSASPRGNRSKTSTSSSKRESTTA